SRHSLVVDDERKGCQCVQLWTPLVDQTSGVQTPHTYNQTPLGSLPLPLVLSRQHIGFCTERPRSQLRVRTFVSAGIERSSQ
ncbi:hypothetical protein ASPSYDRAFT_52089, partial [Aspergillus sydowii CBS 593.65]